MRSVSTQSLLDVWERGLGQPPVQRAVELLTAAYPERPREQIAQWPLGERDAHLLRLREAIFGAQLSALAVCPACGDQLELTFDAGDVMAAPAPVENGQVHTLAIEGCDVQFRLPNSADLVEVSRMADTGAARRALFERCLVRAERNGEAVPAGQLSEGVAQAIGERMAALDPQASVQLALRCAACGHEWQATFDIAAYLWSEVNAWAGRILREVHLLAAAYGWSEAAILDLSPTRRQCYLEMLGGE